MSSNLRQPPCRCGVITVFLPITAAGFGPLPFRGARLPEQQQDDHRRLQGEAGKAVDGIKADEGAQGAETAIAVLLDAIDATAADETGLIAARGPVILSKAALSFDATINDAAKKAAKHTQLAAAGLVARETA